LRLRHALDATVWSLNLHDFILIAMSAIIWRRCCSPAMKPAGDLDASPGVAV